MAELLESLSAFTVYLSISAVGFLFLLLSFTFGEIFEHFHIDHDMDHGDADGAGGPFFLSPRILAVFITAFGATGAIASYYGLNILASSGVGFVSGVVFAGIIFSFAKFLYGQQATSQIKVMDVVGQTARVIVGIPKDGVGQIRCRIGEELVDKVARTRTGEAVPMNASVLVEEVVGEIVIVKKSS